MGGNGFVVVWEDVAGDEDVGVGGSAAFGGYDVCVVHGRDLVYDSDESLVPAVLVIFLFCAASRGT